VTFVTAVMTARRGAALAVLATTVWGVQVAPASATGIRGSWAGAGYVGRGPDRVLSDRVIVRVQRLRVGRRAGRVTLLGIESEPACHGPIRYLGRSPRGGYRFVYREMNDAAAARDECGVASHILLVPHGARLFMRDSDRHWYPKTGGVALAWLTRTLR
jgi:hypothetical protein